MLKQSLFLPLAVTLGAGLAAPVPAQTAPAAPAPAAAPEAPASASAPAAPEGEAGDISGTYSFDPHHSQVIFSYDHMGFSTSRGLINGVAGTVTLDKANPTKSTVEASFPLSAIRTVTPGLDKHLMSDDFFKGLAPETPVTFKSTRVEMDGDDAAKVTGDLTLNGVTRPVTLEVEMRKAGPNPMTKRPAVGFEIEGRLKRSDFNLGAFVPAVGDEIEFDIAVEAAKG